MFQVTLSTLSVCQVHCRFLKRGSSPAAGHKSYVLPIYAFKLHRVVPPHSLNPCAPSLTLKLILSIDYTCFILVPGISDIFVGSFNGTGSQSSLNPSGISTSDVSVIQIPQSYSRFLCKGRRVLTSLIFPYWNDCELALAYPTQIPSQITFSRAGKLFR